jgi:thiol-disulfide isomerase/thioredoxin
MKLIHITYAIVFIILTMLSYHTNAQNTKNVNLEVTDSKGNLILLGQTTRERLQQAPFSDWFNKNYQDYIVDSATAAQLKPLVKGKQFDIFMATWCGDSRREVPRMYKILDYLGVDATHIRLINVNNHDSAYKQSPTHEERGLNIIRVPDLLIYESNKETGRIIEYPVVSLEKDLLAILTRQPYTPNYSNKSPSPRD